MLLPKIGASLLTHLALIHLATIGQLRENVGLSRGIANESLK
jgi:hypothetical protein